MFFCMKVKQTGRDKATEDKDNWESSKLKVMD